MLFMPDHKGTLQHSVSLIEKDKIKVPCKKCNGTGDIKGILYNSKCSKCNVSGKITILFY